VSTDEQTDVSADVALSSTSTFDASNSGPATSDTVAAPFAAAAAEAAATPAKDTARDEAAADAAQQQAYSAMPASPADVPSTQQAAAQPSPHSSPVQRSSGSLSSRRSSRTRVGEPAVSSPSVLPSQPAAQQQTQQQLLQQQQQQSLCTDLGTQPLLTAPASIAAGPSNASGQQSCEEAMSYTITAETGCEPSQPCGMLAPSYHKAASSSILSLHIHGTSQLVPDVLLTDPVVRLHVVHAATGEYVRIMQQLDTTEAKQQQLQQQQQDREQEREQQEQQQGPAAGGSSPSRLAGGSSSLPRTRHPVSNDVQAEVWWSTAPTCVL
jgi:hypothetical protein